MEGGPDITHTHTYLLKLLHTATESESMLRVFAAVSLVYYYWTRTKGSRNFRDCGSDAPSSRRETSVVQSSLFDRSTSVDLRFRRLSPKRAITAAQLASIPPGDPLRMRAVSFSSSSSSAIRAERGRLREPQEIPIDIDR